MKTRDLKAIKAPAPLVIALLLAASVPAFPAQEARVYYGDGGEFSVNSGGVLSTIPVPRGAAGSVLLSRGDVILTGPGARLEIQLIPSATVIMLGENSSLVYNGYDEQGRFTDLNFQYGRMRAVTGGAPAGAAGAGAGAGITEGQALMIRAGIAAARLDAGDLGAEYLMEPARLGAPGGPSSYLRLYSFKNGSVVSPFDQSGKPVGDQTITINEHEGLYMKAASSMFFTERMPLQAQDYQYWAARNFTGTPPLPMPDVTIRPPQGPEMGAAPGGVVGGGAEAGAGAVQYTPSIERLLKARRIKNAAVIIGTALTLAGGGLQVYASREYGADSAEGRNIGMLSYAPLGVGLFSLFTGLFYNPSGF